MLSECIKPAEKSATTAQEGPEQVFLTTFDWGRGIMEWGAPHGRMARWLPARVISHLKKDCLWVMDRSDIHMYPSSWRDLGVDLGKVHFLYEEKPLRSFKSLIHDPPFSLLVLDSKDFLKAGDLNFITQLSRQANKPCFLIRPFYLSHRNGNPFAKYRFNSFYDFQTHSLKVVTLKGGRAIQPFQIPLRQCQGGL